MTAAADRSCGSFLLVLLELRRRRLDERLLPDLRDLVIQADLLGDGQRLGRLSALASGHFQIHFLALGWILHSWRRPRALYLMSWCRWLAHEEAFI